MRQIEAALGAALLTPYKTEVYGADTTFYLAVGSPPPSPSKPDPR